MQVESRSPRQGVRLQSTVTAALGATPALHQLFARIRDVTAPSLLGAGENWPPLGSAPVGWRFSGSCAKPPAEGNDESLHRPRGMKSGDNLPSGGVYDDDFPTQ